MGCVGDVARAVCPGDQRGGAGPARSHSCRRSRRGGCQAARAGAAALTSHHPLPPCVCPPLATTVAARSRSFPLFNAPVAPRRAPFCRRCLRARTRGFSSLLNLRAWARRSRDLVAGRCPRRSMERASLRLGDRALALLVLLSGAPTSLLALACLLGTSEIMLCGCARRVDRRV
jgi:hypothetical protein